jgi:hypothetical protein
MILNNALTLFYLGNSIGKFALWTKPALYNYQSQYSQEEIDNSFTLS